MNKEYVEVLVDRIEAGLDHLTEENNRLRAALSEIAKRGANPISKYGYGKKTPWIRLADDVWKIASDALEGKEIARYARNAIVPEL